MAVERAADDDLMAIVGEVLHSVDGVFGTRVSFVSRIEGDRFEIVDASDNEGMGFEAGLALDTADSF